MPTKLPDIELVTLLPWAKPFDGPEWMFEPKYDGFRGLLYGSASGCEIRTRRAHRAERYTDLRERVARVLDGRQAVLDGEIVSLDEKGKPVFRDLLKGRGYLAFAAADLVWLDGQDLRAVAAGGAQAAPDRPAPFRHRAALQDLHARGARAGAVRDRAPDGPRGRRRQAGRRPLRAGNAVVRDSESGLPAG